MNQYRINESAAGWEVITSNVSTGFRTVDAFQTQQEAQMHVNQRQSSDEYIRRSQFDAMAAGGRAVTMSGGYSNISAGLDYIDSSINDLNGLINRGVKSKPEPSQLDRIEKKMDRILTMLDTQLTNAELDVLNDDLQFDADAEA